MQQTHSARIAPPAPRGTRLRVWLWCGLLLGGLLLAPLTADKQPAAASIYDSDDAPFTLNWASNEANLTHALAWGDYDNDGDLDLATGSADAPARLYRNDAARLTPGAVWEAAGGSVRALAWGDYDNDGDLDLATGSADTGLALYANDAGTLAPTAAWQGQAAGPVHTLAWGDINGDGLLDLLVGGAFSPAHLYLGTGTALRGQASWQPADTHAAALALADVDNDGDPDLALGSADAPARLYLNQNGTLARTPSWTAEAPGASSRLAWGDYDNDGAPDLAVGSANTPARLYPNTNGTLAPTAAWQAVGASGTTALAWADADRDGDLDLAVGSQSAPVRLYLNTGGALATSVAWAAGERGMTTSLAWGDMDNDGDPDLASSNESGPTWLYRNNSPLLGPEPAWQPGGPQPPDPTRPVQTAWGDVDGDGDPDVALGLEGVPVQLFLTEAGTPAPTPAWRAAEHSAVRALAWGDADGDGDLDLAVGSADAPTRLYTNLGDALEQRASWAAAPAGATTALAWGDVDNDGDLDLAATAGEADGALLLYINSDGTLEKHASWHASERAALRSLAWGDVDGDGDLDLAASAADAPVRLYLNQQGTLAATASWESAAADTIASLAWGDSDGDGDLDLAAGGVGSIRIYANTGGTLRPTFDWVSADGGSTRSLAWVDIDSDSDLDLLAGNASAPTRLYLNTDGQLGLRAAWEAQPQMGAASSTVAWGDVDNDGDPDVLAGAGWLFRNQRTTPTHASAAPAVVLGQPTPAMHAPGGPAPVWQAPTSVAVPFALHHPTGMPVARVAGFFSLDGGGTWQPAVAAPGSDVALLTTRPADSAAPAWPYTFVWDTWQSGFFGQAHTVVFRLVAYPPPYQEPWQPGSVYAPAVAFHLPTPGIAGATAASTPPMHIGSNQIRVQASDQPAAEALVHHMPAQQAHTRLLTSRTGAALRTDPNGFLRGASSLAVGDALVAALPVEAAPDVTRYWLSAPPTPDGLAVQPVAAPGTQELTVSADNPLLLFDLSVSLEWDARNDTPFLEQLAYDLERTSAILYDWTDGQAALGQITVYHDRAEWDYAHVRVYATNRLRPNANQGGFVSSPRADPDDATLLYEPGQIRMGAVWNRYGEADGMLGEDWPRTLAHELGHYLFFLDDNYLGLDDAGRIVPVRACPGAMSDPYLDNHSEFHPAAGWLPACAGTLSQQATQRADWETITAFYPALHAPERFDANPGPATLPLDVTSVAFVAPDAPATTLTVPLLYLVDASGAAVIPSRTARAYLFQPDRGAIIDQGRPVLDYVEARGARPGDRLCVYDLEAGRQGCETIRTGDQQIALTRLGPAQPWQPDVRITPVSTQTVQLAVERVPAGLTLWAQLYPASGTASPVVQLAFLGDNRYGGQVTFASDSMAVLEGALHVWVDEADDTGTRREYMTDYAIGGNPGSQRKRGAPDEAHPGSQRKRGAPRVNPGSQRKRGAPVLSTDGQAILYGQDLQFAPGEFYVLQSTTAFDAPPWATVVGQAYRLTATPNAPQLAGQTSLNISYVSREVPPGSEDWIQMYYWDDEAAIWQPLPTTLDADQNSASAVTRGPGAYALMASVALVLDGPGWHNLVYPVAGTRPVDEALQSIAGDYTSVWQYDPGSVYDPAPRTAWQSWQGYHADTPAWVNDLETLAFGEGYWLHATRPLTLYLRGAASTLNSAAEPGEPGPGSAPASATSLLNAPAVYYDRVRLDSAVLSAADGAGSVQAFVGDTLCGVGALHEDNDQVMYAVKVVADGTGGVPGCGTPDAPVHITLDGQTIAWVRWNNQQAHNLAVSPGIHLAERQQIWLPVIVR